MRNSNNRRILVIDDNQTIHEDFRKILTANDAFNQDLDAAETALFGSPSQTSALPKFEVDSALQGQEGLAMVQRALAERKPYAMAFVDVRMPPGWDGVETTTRIWQHDPEIQIVICTAYSEYSWDRMIEKLGHSDRLLILKKPFDNIEVLQLANALTEKWRLLQETKNQLAQLEQKVNERTQQLQCTNQKLEAEIVERKQAEEALRESQETVLRQERLAVVGQLSAGLAHEFNNILTVIQGHADLVLMQPQLDAEATDSLRQIRMSADRAASLTRQMLAFSRKQVMRRQSLDLNQVISHTTEMLSSVLGDNIKVSFLPGSKLPIYADSGMIEQIILNLAVNARDAMPKGGQITINTADVEVAEKDLAQHPTNESSAGRFVCLRVSDTGCGMDEATQRRVFEPFFTTKDVGKGTGLGLSTVYGIVKQHDGWIEVSSEVGRGTTFKIFFPVSETAIAAPEPPRIVPMHGEEKTILVVEDELALRTFVRVYLQRQGFFVLEAASGLEALEIWRKHSGKIGLVLTDMVMPDKLTGRDLAKKLREDKPGLPVIYSSGYSEHLLEVETWGDDNRFLAKPYPPARLMQMVQECLEEAKGSEVNAQTKRE